MTDELEHKYTQPIYERIICNKAPENFNHEILQEIYVDERKIHTSDKRLTKDDVIKMEAYKDEGKIIASWNG
jgi:hypothetical protein